MPSRPSIFYAHSLPGQPPETGERLETHATAVARLAKDFASAFGAAEWGELLGRWHDLGKRSAEFQAYLFATSDPDAAEKAHGPDHSTCLLYTSPSPRDR